MLLYLKLITICSINHFWREKNDFLMLENSSLFTVATLKKLNTERWKDKKEFLRVIYCRICCTCRSLKKNFFYEQKSEFGQQLNSTKTFLTRLTKEEFFFIVDERRKKDWEKENNYSLVIIGSISIFEESPHLFMQQSSLKISWKNFFLDFFIELEEREKKFKCCGEICVWIFL